MINVGNYYVVVKLNFPVLQPILSNSGKRIIEKNLPPIPNLHKDPSLSFP